MAQLTQLQDEGLETFSEIKMIGGMTHRGGNLG